MKPITGKKLITQNGLFVYCDGVFFFTNKQLTERRPWKITISKGIMPHFDEWRRLREAHNLTELPLTPAELIRASSMVEHMKQPIEMWLTPQELQARRKFLLHSAKKHQTKLNVRVPCTKTLLGKKLQEVFS